MKEALQLLGFDFGTKRIGVAVGQQLTETAHAVGFIPAKEGIPQWEEIDKLVKEWQPETLVVGIPLNMDGSMSEMAFRARKFKNRMKVRYNLPCFGVDERKSTQEAKEIAYSHEAMSHFGKQSKNHIDDIAATIIIQNWYRYGALKDI